MEAAPLRIDKKERMFLTLAGLAGPAFYSSALIQLLELLDRLPFSGLWHLRLEEMPMSEYVFRAPSEPSPPPIQDPIDPPENPDAPVREPDPEEPGQI